MAQRYSFSMAPGRSACLIAARTGLSLSSTVTRNEMVALGLRSGADIPTRKLAKKLYPMGRLRVGLPMALVIVGLLVHGAGGATPTAAAGETPAVPTPLQRRYLNRAETTLKRAAETANVSVEKRIAILLLQNAIYARLRDTAAKGRTSKELTAAFKRAEEIRELQGLSATDGPLQILRRLAASAQEGFQAPDSNASRAGTATEDASAEQVVSQVLLDIGGRKRSFDRPCLYSGLALQVSDVNGLAHQRIRALSLMSLCAIADKELDIALAAYLEADIAQRELQSVAFSGDLQQLGLFLQELATTQSFLQGARNPIDSQTMDLLTSSYKAYEKDRDFERLTANVTLVRDILQLTDDHSDLWMAHYFLALVYKDRKDADAELSELEALVQDFIDIDEDVGKELMEKDDQARAVIVQSADMMTELAYQAVVGARPKRGGEKDSSEAKQASETDLTLDRAIDVVRVAATALKRIGHWRGIEGAHIQPLLALTALEADRSPRRRQVVLDLYQELVDAFTAVGPQLAGDPKALDALRDRLNALNLVVLSMAFDEPIRGEQEFAFARNIHDVTQRALHQILQQPGLILSYDLAWADLLLTAKHPDEALNIYEVALAQEDLPKDVPHLLGNPMLPPAGIEGFLYSRRGVAQQMVGNLDEAMASQERALALSKQADDPIGEIRALLSQVVLSDHTGNWATGRKLAAQARAIAEQMRTGQEHDYKSVPRSIDKMTAPEFNLGSLITGSLKSLMAADGIVMSIRLADESRGLLAVANARMNPEPPMFSEVLETMQSRRLHRGEGAADFVSMLTDTGRCLLLLGDPIKAEALFARASDVSRDLGLDEPLAQALLYHARLYLKEHRYYSLFENRPEHQLRWGISANDSRNVLLARRTLDEAFRVVGKGDVNPLRLAILASAIEAWRTDPADEVQLTHWVELGIKEFQEHKLDFQKDDRFEKSREFRYPLSDLFAELEGQADTARDRGDEHEKAFDWVSARREWLRAKTIYLAIDDYDAATKEVVKEASFWSYLNRTDAELELLESASSTNIGAVSYEVKGRERIAAVPQITWHTDGSSSISGVAFRPFEFSDDLGDIKVTMAQANIGAQVSLADRYARLGRWENVTRLEERILKENASDTSYGLVARLLFTTMHLDSGRATTAIPRLREILGVAQKRFKDLLKQLPPADVVVDLSSEKVEVKVKDSASLESISDGGLDPGAILDIKNAARVEVLTMLFLGRAQVLVGNNEEAIDTLLEAAHLSEKYKDWTTAAQSYHALGLLFQNSDYDSALKHLLRARDLTADTLVRKDLFSGGESFPAVEIREALGRLHYDRRDWTTAVKYDWEAAQAYESIRTELSLQDLQQPLMHRLSEVYERLVAATLGGSAGPKAAVSDPKAIAQAFWYSESAKSRALLDVMGIAHQTHDGNPSTEQATGEEQLRRQIEATTAEADAVRHSEGRSDRVDLLEERLERMRRDYEKLQIDKQVAEAEHRFSEGLQPLPASALQGRLAILNRGHDQETVLMSFFVAEDRIYVWMVSESSIELDLVAVSAADLEQRVDEFIRAIDEPVVATRKSDPLYSLLFGKFRDRIANKRLGIAPHGILHRLPFGALRYDGAYLIERSALFYLPSASLLPYLLDRHSNRPASALVLADPDGTLDYSLLEATKIAEVLGEGKVKVCTRAEADRSAFRELQGDYSILHLATHGNFNPRFPILSGMILSDGQLLLSEVANLNRLGADLVVLSACNTGESKIESGDEVIGLGSAFIRAGASSILVSLWRAQDDSTPVFIERFYRHLIVDGMPRDLAVGEAQRSMIKDGYPPISWSGFLLVGLQ